MLSRECKLRRHVVCTLIAAVTLVGCAAHEAVTGPQQKNAEAKTASEMVSEDYGFIRAESLLKLLDESCTWPQGKPHHGGRNGVYELGSPL